MKHIRIETRRYKMAKQKYHYRFWDVEEIELLITLYNSGTDYETMTKSFVQRTVKSLTSKIKLLKKDKLYARKMKLRQDSISVEQKKLILKLYENSDLSNNEIGRALRINVNTVKTVIYRKDKQDENRK